MNIVNRSLGAIAFGLMVSFGASAEEDATLSANLEMPEGTTVMITRDGVTSVGVNGQALEVDDNLLFSEGSEAKVVFNPCDSNQELTLGELYTVPESSPCAGMWSGIGSNRSVLLLLGATAGAALLISESENNTSSP